MVSPTVDRDEVEQVEHSVRTCLLLLHRRAHRSPSFGTLEQRLPDALLTDEISVHSPPFETGLSIFYNRCVQRRTTAKLRHLILQPPHLITAGFKITAPATWASVDTEISDKSPIFLDS